MDKHSFETRSLDQTDVALCLLIFGMHLISHIPKDDGDDSLYLTLHRTFMQLYPVLPPSIDLIQCAVLVSAYEHGQGMNDAAYITISIAARLSQIIELDSSSRRSSCATGQDLGERIASRITLWGLSMSDG